MTLQANSGGGLLQPIQCIKDVSWLIRLHKIDMARGFVFDYMHTVLLGVVKLSPWQWHGGASKHYVLSTEDLTILRAAGCDSNVTAGHMYPHVFIHGQKYEAEPKEIVNKFNNSFCHVEDVGLFCIQNIVVINNLCFLKCQKVSLLQSTKCYPNLYQYCAEVE